MLFVKSKPQVNMQDVEKLAEARIPETTIGTSYLIKRKGYIMGVKDIEYKLSAKEQQLKEANELINSLRTKLKTYGYVDNKIKSENMQKERIKLVQNVICDYLAVTMDQIRAKDNRPATAWARHLMVYFLNFYAQLKPSYVGEYVNKERTVFYNSRNFVRNILDSKDYEGYKKEKADFEAINNFLKQD